MVTIILTMNNDDADNDDELKGMIIKIIAK